MVLLASPHLLTIQEITMLLMESLHIYKAQLQSMELYRSCIKDSRLHLRACFRYGTTYLTINPFISTKLFKIHLENLIFLSWYFIILLIVLILKILQLILYIVKTSKNDLLLWYNVGNILCEFFLQIFDIWPNIFYTSWTISKVATKTSVATMIWLIWYENIVRPNIEYQILLHGYYWSIPKLQWHHCRLGMDK